jgi:RNA polymerase sigma-70 factor (ECF subfamily)
LDLEDVFRSHQREVFAYFLRMVGDANDAEELTQETFVRACGAALRFRGDSSVRTWLFGIGRRVLLEASRAGLFDRSTPVDETHAPSTNDPPADERLYQERVLSELRPSDREAIVMVDVLGFEPIEVATLFGISPEAFRVRLHRARARFREVYDR